MTNLGRKFCLVDFQSKCVLDLTTPKVAHAWKFVHDEIGYNYRTPNLNAAIVGAQLEKLLSCVEAKIKQAEQYSKSFDEHWIRCVTEQSDCRENYWLMTRVLNKAERDAFLDQNHKARIMTRPIWALIHRLPMFQHYISGDLYNAE